MEEILEISQRILDHITLFITFQRVWHNVFHSVIAGVTQTSVFTATLLSLHDNYLLSSITNPIRSYANGFRLYFNFQFL